MLTATASFCGASLDWSVPGLDDFLGLASDEEEKEDGDHDPTRRHSHLPEGVQAGSLPVPSTTAAAAVDPADVDYDEYV